MYSVQPRATKFDAVTQMEGHVLDVSHAPIKRGRGCSVANILGRLETPIPFKVQRPNSASITWERGMFLDQSLTPHHRMGPQLSQNFLRPSTYVHTVWGTAITFCIVIKLDESFTGSITPPALAIFCDTNAKLLTRDLFAAANLFVYVSTPTYLSWVQQQARITSRLMRINDDDNVCTVPIIFTDVHNRSYSSLGYYSS